MDSKQMFTTIAIIWIAAMFVSIFAPAMGTGGESIPIASWTAPVCATVATLFLMRFGKQS